MGLFKSGEVADLKAKARKALDRYRAIAQHYDCGTALLKEVSPKAAAAAEEFNTAMRRLAEIDPACPKWEPL